ncbi:hypothetical protein CSAL01_03651 [Colletotrichum salicis]|uniref:Uncharacterized protein n=1 Tax=Colletotrichum salicis TaxID=1209931 RepID=A0A135RQA5_9PEZI|nr:hypothetical protein CSAL01_03651 [Colletotrichum salicis]
MCIKTTYHYDCGHISSFTPYCERAFDNCPYRITARRCSNPTLAEKTVRGVCDAIECKYEEWDRRWICHKCDMDNENSMTCEGNDCEHGFCDGCDPWESCLANIPHRTPEEMRQAELRAMGLEPEEQSQSSVDSQSSVQSRSTANSQSTVQSAPTQLSEPTQQTENAEYPKQATPPKFHCSGCGTCKPARDELSQRRSQRQPPSVPVYEFGAGDWI